jgi:4-diphosphocytidyl-2-C-methyl-D-erythritol kinase
MIASDPKRWWPAPAKLNLCLHVTARRADGYHELQTIFQLISLADQLSFDLRDDHRIVRLDYEGAAADALSGVGEDQDLCVRAARALQLRTGVTAGATIRIRKNIPVGGGLGGGSSDAATTLVVLNALWQGGLSTDELAEIGMALGADVPVFVRGFSGLGEGVGERLTPLELPNSWFLVIHPGVSIPTRDVFQAPELTRNSPVLTIAALLASGGRNDCEPVVRARYPEVAAALDWLGRYASARLTGTGSCLFARFASAAEAERVAARVPDVWRAYVVQGLAESPLRQSL